MLFTKFIDKIKEKNKEKKIINIIFDNNIKSTITDLFISLNEEDVEILFILSYYLIQKIKLLFNIEDEQFLQNKNQDLKAIILLLLPFIDNEKPMDFANLTNLLYNYEDDKIQKNILKMNRLDVLPTKFKYGNIALGLFNKDNENLLDLTVENEKLINVIIYHNFMALLETLSMINGKLYINWGNIVPIIDYKNSNLYKKTVDYFSETNNIVKDVEINNGLYIGEIYNVYRNIYYEEIKKYKWLIFVINYKKKQYIVQYLKNFFEDWYDYDDYSEIIDSKKNDFIEKMNNITIDEYKIWKEIIIFMVNNYSKIDKIPNDIRKPFEINIEEKNDRGNADGQKTEYADEKYEKIEDDDIKKFFLNVGFSMIWDYIKESLTVFKNTIFGHNLIKENKIIDIFNDKLNLKNIYNIGKTLSHGKTKDWDLLPTKYNSLEEDQKIYFWKRFNDSNIKNWLNLDANLYREGFKNPDEIIKKMNDIQESFDEKEENELSHKINLVWDYLLYAGVLTEFNYIPNLNKETYKKNITANFKKNTNWENAYYYLSNDTFKNLRKIRTTDSTTTGYSEKKYFNEIIANQSWYGFYAMNWVAQIGFFHHYINHRVLFITGSTGTGKSTQIPKLMLYSLKMLDYKNNGKVICTQPRIGPTTSNANRVSNELGVPIEQPSYGAKSTLLRTNNNYVQFRHQNGSHVKKHCPHLTFRIVTDGTLYSEIINNPKLKIKIPSNTIFLPADEILGKNIYDIFIVDEAHEHNTNMDLLLTLARQTCYYNNSVKFVIVSATMQDDEPIYRRFYQCINDNLVYPYKSKYNNIFADEKEDFFLHDSIYLDRRYDISQPGQTTLFTINDIYLDASIVSVNKSDADNSKIAQEKSYEKIKKICSESVKGDILLFVNGISDIMRALKYLNKNLPEGNIALPYYAELNGRYKIIIEGIDKAINKIKTKPEDVELTWGSDYIEDKTVPDGKYKRAIIIATNVAEASITISSLKYVIDNGYAKVNIYDDNLQNSKLIVEMISEASRIQRRGRVGRSSNGTVYYMYQKNARKNITPKYKINQEDSCKLYIDLLTDKIKEKNQIQKINEDINIYKINSKYKEYWDDKYYSFMSTEKLKYLERYEDGCSFELINDNSGDFHIIHPYENFIIRNINNDIIIDDKNNDNNKNIRAKYISLYKRLYQKNILKNINALLINNEKNIDPKNIYINSDFLGNLKKIKSVFQFEDSNNIVLLMGMAYSSFEIILSLLIMLPLISYNIDTLFIKPMKKKENSDLLFIYEIIEKFKNEFKLSIFQTQIYDYNYFKIISSTDFDKKKKQITESPYLVLPYGITPDIYNRFIEMNNDNEDDEEKYNEGETSSKIVEIYKQINMSDWCNKNNIKYEIIIKFVEKYTKNILKKLLKDNKSKDNKSKKPFLSDIQYCRGSLSINEKIFKPFICGYPFNIALKLDYNNNFYLLDNLTKVTNKKKNVDSIIFYCNLNNELEMNITNTINIDWLKPVIPIYKNNFNNNKFWNYIYKQLANSW